MMSSLSPLRKASPGEHRCIIRDALGLYRAIVVSTVYTHYSSSAEIPVPAVFKALKHCINSHPILSAVVADARTERPAFARPPSINLENHIRVLEPTRLSENDNSPQQAVIQRALLAAHDEPLPITNDIPQWRLVLCRLSPQSPQTQPETQRLLAAFAYSHSLGDGTSGLAFHASLQRGLQLADSPECPYTIDPLSTSPSAPLLPPLEEAGKLAISWSFLLSPLLGEYLPKPLAGLLGLRAATTPDAPDMWRGGPKSADADSTDLSMGIEVLTVPPATLDGVLVACRARGVRLTGLLHQLIVRALSSNLPTDTPAGSFVAQTATDLRGCVPAVLGKDDMANCSSVDYEVFPRDETPALTAMHWEAAARTTERLAASASTLKDQPIGLLCYLTNFRAWVLAQASKPRDTSYLLSNLGAFGGSDNGSAWGVEAVVFSQSADAVGSPIAFNVASKRGGNMSVVLTWKLGALGVKDEHRLAAALNDSLSESLQSIADGQGG